MSKAFLITFAAAIVVIGAFIWLGFEKTEGNHLAPSGSIGKLRWAKATDDVTFLVIDFNVKNGSDRDMIVRSIEAAIDTADGKTVMGSSVAAADVESAFKNYPLLGDQYNPILRERATIPAHGQVDRMVGVRFDLPYDKAVGGKRVVLRLEDVTGPVVELTK